MKKSLAAKLIKNAQEKFALDALTEYSNEHGKEDLTDDVLMMLQSGLNAHVITNKEEALAYIKKAIKMRDMTPEQLEAETGIMADEDVLKDSDVSFGTGNYGDK